MSKPTNAKLAFTLDDLIPVLGEPDQKGDNSFLYSQTLKATQATGGINIAFNSKDAKGFVFAAGLFTSQLFTKAESKQIVDFIDSIGEEKEIGRFKVTVSESTTPQGWRQVRFSPKEAVPELPSKLTKAIWSKSTGMKLTLIPAGTFTMGSPASEADRGTDESPQHSVRITESFYMDVYEVTQEE